MSNHDLSSTQTDAFWSRFGDVLATPECVPEELFLPYEWSQLDATRQKQLLEHTANCPVCKANKLLAERFEEATSNVSHIRPASSNTRSSGHWPTTLAAGVLAALGLGIWFGGSESVRPTLPVAPATNDVTRGAAIVLDGRIEAAQPVLEWNRVAGATTYRLLARDVADNIVWSEETEQLSFVLDSKLSASMTSWRWSLEALGPNREVVAISRTLLGESIAPY